MLIVGVRAFKVDAPSSQGQSSVSVSVSVQTEQTGLVNAKTFDITRIAANIEASHLYL